MQSDLLYCLDLSSGSRQQIPLPFPKETAVMLGSFDGVHLGHRALIRRTVETAEAEGLLPAVFLFEIPPSDFLRSPPPAHLSTLDEKLSLLSRLGIRYAFLGSFPRLSSCPPACFLTELLQKLCAAKAVICGFNYTFGANGRGDPAALKAWFGENAHIVPSVTHGGETVSSSRIRLLLEDGQIEEGGILLGSPYSLTAPVLHGKALGRTISFPTANQLFPKGKLIPKCGIYLTRVTRAKGDPFYAVTNVGSRPTFDDGDHITAESYLLDFSGDLYGEIIETAFLRRIRDEKKMASVKELKETIACDVERARMILKSIEP